MLYTRACVRLFFVRRAYVACMCTYMAHLQCGKTPARTGCFALSRCGIHFEWCDYLRVFISIDITTTHDTKLPEWGAASRGAHTVVCFITHAGYSFPFRTPASCERICPRVRVRNSIRRRVAGAYEYCTDRTRCCCHYHKSHERRKHKAKTHVARIASRSLAYYVRWCAAAALARI